MQVPNARKYVRESVEVSDADQVTGGMYRFEAKVILYQIWGRTVRSVLLCYSKLLHRFSSKMQEEF